MTRYLITMLILLDMYSASANLDPVNAVIGDKSFVMTFGRTPNSHTSENLRINTHLSYVEMLLRSSDTRSLSPSARQNRLLMLDLLHRYTSTGIFPVNHDYIYQRRPCFIDNEGRICAVGYLMQQSSGNAFVETINKRHKYDYLTHMNEPAITRWASANGLTLEECAMIQPQYNFGPPPNTPPVAATIPTGYGITSGILGGLNIAASVINITSRSTPTSRVISYISVLTGTAEVIVGAVKIKKPTTFYYINSSYPLKTTYKAQNRLSYANIAVGAAAITTGIVRLMRKHHTNLRKGVFNVYALPGIVATGPVMGCTFTKTIN